MKKIKIIFLLLLAVVFSWCQNDFTAHHQKTADYKKQKIVVQEYLKKFRPENIQEFKSIELYHTPQSKSFNLLGKIVNRINWAQERVYLSSYIFTEKRIFEALQNAQKRGIDVKVLMEKNVYKAPFLNNNRFRDLESAWVEVAWSNPDLYSLNHTKLLIIDDKAIVSTGNYSYSSFAYNREFFLQIWDTDFVDILTQIFRSDYIWEANTHYDDRLVLSPLLTRSKFSTLVSSAQDSIKIYSQTFSDDTLEVELSKAVQAWIDVQIIFPELKEIESNRESYKIFTDAWVQVHTLKKPKLHAKAMLVDDTYLYIGSINFSYYSIEQNREIGLLITNPEIIEKFLQVWKQDKQ
jgi:phosphatidylserine/phosphatidylglycerophosphate/cardiolipin synthase-like enzyme